MVVRQTLLKRCRVSKNLGFQTNLFPFKRLTPRQFDLFLKTVPVFPPNRVSDLIKSLPDPPLQQEISTFFHGKFNQRLTATLQSFPSGRVQNSEGCEGMTQSVCRYLHRRGSRPVAEIERLNDARRKLSMIYGPLPPRKTGKERETQWNKHLLMTLERRLDVILVRAGFFGSVYQARQCVFHRLATVNDQPVQSGSYLCEPGDVVRVSPKLRPQIASFWTKEDRTHAGTQQPNAKLISRGLHLEVDLRTLTVVYLYPPQRVVLPALIDFDALNFKK